jgi:hypothetical protein
VSALQHILLRQPHLLEIGGADDVEPVGEAGVEIMGGFFAGTGGFAAGIAGGGSAYSNCSRETSPRVSACTST